MSKTIDRHIQIDNWIFEVKMVRALRVQNYGEPYSAIANITLNGDSAHIDGLMNKDASEFDPQDINTLKEFCRMMDSKRVQVEQLNTITSPSRTADVKQLKQA